MSRKILIIDDREKRPYLHLPVEVVDTIKSLPGVSFQSGVHGVSLDDYDIIAIHGSYMKTQGLFDSLRALGTYLIIFSGGISETTSSARGRIVTMGSEVFYSNKLLPFCRNVIEGEAEIQPFKLIYGIDGWQLPMFMRLRQLDWLDKENDNFDAEEEKKELMGMLSVESIKEVERKIHELSLGI